jgi:diphthine synthase
MLYLIGLGVWDEKDVSLRGMELCKKADSIYCELYTANWGGDLRKLEKMIGKKIVLLERKDLEEESESFLKKAKSSNIVLLVPGDPLVATTHIHLLMEAQKLRIPYKIIHSSSILTAIARTGLQAYKFGRVVTVAKPEGKFQPKSFYKVIKENEKQGLHTLLLLDRNMHTKEALDILLEIESREKQKILKNKKILLCSRLGSKSEKILYGRVKNLLSNDLPEPAIIIIPGKLHFMEKEFLEGF